MALGSFFAKAPQVALAASLGSLLMIITAFTVEGMPELEKLLKVSLYGCLVAALVALSAPLRGLSRASGLVGVNAFGTTIFLGTALGLAYLNLKPQRQGWQWPFLVLMGIAELLTFSRGGWLGFITACAVFYLRQRKAIAVFLVLLLIFGGLASQWPALAQRGKSILSFAANQDRIRIYKRTVDMIKKAPLFGVGAASFASTYEDYVQPGEELITHAHNIYLSTFVELGIFGGILFLLLLAKVVTSAWQFRGSAVGRGILAGILGCLIHGFFDITIFGIHVGMGFWALGGIALAKAESLEEKFQLPKSVKIEAGEDR